MNTPPNNFPGDVSIGGSISANWFSLSPNCVGDAQIPVGAGIDTSKTDHRAHMHYSSQIGVAFATDERVLYIVVPATADVVDFCAGAVTPCGTATSVAVDLKVNGASILSAPITLNNTQTAYQQVFASIATAGLTEGQVVAIYLTLTGANPPQGVFAQLRVDEPYQ